MAQDIQIEATPRSLDEKTPACSVGETPWHSAPAGLAAATRAVRESLANVRVRWMRVTGVLVVLTCALCVTELLCGNTFYDAGTVWDVLWGAEVKGATYAVWEVRLPRLLAGALVGFAFGMAGNTFQTMLRNPLASPDVIGITSGASVVAVFCILVVGMGAAQASVWAMLGSLAVAAAIFALANVGGFSIGKFVLVGLGVQAFMRAVTSYLLLKGAEYDVPMALRWLSGSLSGTTMADVTALLAVIPLAAVVAVLAKQLRVLELGDAAAIGLGARPLALRAALTVCSVAMIALGTAVTGPVACVTLLAGPIASRLVGAASSAAVPAGLIGIVLVLLADLVGQYVLGTRFPVGVVTGILGTPYLLYLLVNLNKKGTL